MQLSEEGRVEGERSKGSFHSPSPFHIFLPLPYFWKAYLTTKQATQSKNNIIYITVFLKHKPGSKDYLVHKLHIIWPSPNYFS